MAVSVQPCEIKPGMRVTFHDGDDEMSGVVNGQPWVYFAGVGPGAVARIPVACTNGRVLDVAGSNIVSVTP